MEINECPQCGAPVNASERKCGYCKAEFFVTSLAYLGNLDPPTIGKYMKHYKELTREAPDDAEGILGLGLCYLQMNNYLLAKKSFEKVIELAPEISQAYYYYALSSVAGRRLMSLPLKDVRILEAYLNTAILIDSNPPQYKLFLAMLKRDYYEMNGMRVKQPFVNDLLVEINESKIDAKEIIRLKEAARVGDETIFDSLSGV